MDNAAPVAESNPVQSSAAPVDVLTRPVEAPIPAPIAERVSVDPAIYLPGIKDRVQSMAVYPPLSLRRGEHGIVHVKAILAADGSVVDVSADDEDISGRLRNAALKAVQDAAPFPPMSALVKVTIPVVFEIR